MDEIKFFTKKKKIMYYLSLIIKELRIKFENKWDEIIFMQIEERTIISERNNGDYKKCIYRKQKELSKILS
jgi:hypothetical protein